MRMLKAFAAGSPRAPIAGWGYSSDGESVRLISGRSVVQVHLSPPALSGNRFLLDAYYCEGRGDIAQLGEHRFCKAGVVGSSPTISTISSG